MRMLDFYSLKSDDSFMDKNQLFSRYFKQIFLLEQTVGESVKLSSHMGP